MHINDILAEFKFQFSQSDPGAQLAAELLATRIDAAPGSIGCVRRAAASALVRAGVWLDRREGERVLRPAAN